MEDILEPVVESSSTQAEIDALIAGYGEPLEVIDKPEIINSPEPAPISSGDASPLSDPDAPYGRFVRGKKKGLPKPGPSYVPKAQQAAAPVAISGMIIDGALVILLVDLLIPISISGVNNMVSADKITPDLLKLTDDQKKELKPIINKCMETLSISGNPWAIVFIGLIGCYTMNFMLAKIPSLKK